MSESHVTARAIAAVRARPSQTRGVSSCAAAAQELTPRVWLGLALTATIAVATTWTALTLAYYTDYPVGFFVTSIGFAAWVAASLRRRLC